MSAGGDGADGEKGEAMAQWWKKRSKSNDDSDDDDMEYMHGPRPRLLTPRRAVDYARQWQQHQSNDG